MLLMLLLMLLMLLLILDSARSFQRWHCFVVVVVDAAGVFVVDGVQAVLALLLAPSGDQLCY